MDNLSFCLGPKVVILDVELATNEIDVAEFPRHVLGSR